MAKGIFFKYFLWKGRIRSESLIITDTEHEFQHLHILEWNFWVFSFLLCLPLLISSTSLVLTKASTSVKFRLYCHRLFAVATFILPTSEFPISLRALFLFLCPEGQSPSIWSLIGLLVSYKKTSVWVFSGNSRNHLCRGLRNHSWKNICSTLKKSLNIPKPSFFDL